MNDKNEFERMGGVKVEEMPTQENLTPNRTTQENWENMGGVQNNTDSWQWENMGR